ncbi:LysR family transcriptional regulator [Chthonobacter albigriseus]|uniref:LysR family transcriptional regulator n=1 Tax=Chthonobacter albigriseus TaxID=1683161 RepID=UPI0015EEEE97|nr:LysR family transcriptional regulator [Chthonobacter albigriseus]
MHAEVDPSHAMATFRGQRVRNVPTDLLRAFITVVDLKGFTRAGERLGRSQPAISLQIKRLEETIGVPLLDRDQTVPVLTEAGEQVASYARRILALNDELIMRLQRKGRSGRLRIGMPNDYADQYMQDIMRAFQDNDGNVALEVTCDLSVNLLRTFRDGDLDVIVAQTGDGPAEGASFTWREPLTWIGLPGAVDPSDPLRLIAYPEGCNYRRQALAALQREGRSYEIVYQSPSLPGLVAALKTGFGYTVVSRRTALPGLSKLGRADGFPDLSDVVGGLYVRPGIKAPEVNLLANTFADMFYNTMEKPAAA